eukprot:IDg10102t1
MISAATSTPAGSLASCSRGCTRVSTSSNFMSPGATATYQPGETEGPRDNAAASERYTSGRALLLASTPSAYGSGDVAACRAFASSGSGKSSSVCEGATARGLCVCHLRAPGGSASLNAAIVGNGRWVMGGNGLRCAGERSVLTWW